MKAPGHEGRGDLQVATWRRTRNRLDREVYRGAAAFAVTVTTWQRQRVFVTEEAVERCREILEDAGRARGFHILAYCFMPDHLHLLVEGREGTDVVQFVKAFKQQSSFEYKQKSGRVLWQRSCYDHVLRGAAELQPAVEYVIGNPVRASLVDDPATYPFMGGALLRDMLVAT